MNWKRSEIALRRTPFHPQWLAYQFKRQQTQWVQQNASGCVLNVGSGHGDIEDTLDHVSHIVSLDYPETGANLYRSRPDVWGDAQHLPFGDNSIDTVLLLDVLEHVDDDLRALDEVCRVIRANGQLLLSIPFLYPLHDEPHDYRRLTEHAIRNHLQSRGLVIASCAAVGHPIQTASLLMAIALAKTALSAVANRSVLSPLFVAVAAIGVPVVNLVGACLARLGQAQSGSSNFMPTRYHVIATSGRPSSSDP